MYVDFLTGKSQHRRLYRGKELIAKAVGVGKYDQLSIIDATAGLGRDAFVLASLGCNMTLIERSPMMQALLADGLQRAAIEIPEVIARISLLKGDALQLLAEQRADVVYLDPMYPHRDKSALVKKEMRILQDVVGFDEDSSALLILAQAAAKKRVVVKRPRLAENFAECAPDFSYNGKNSRFDVYLAR